MSNVKFEKTHVIKYLVWTFVLAYIIQIGASIIYHRVSVMIGQLILALMMYIPTLGVLLSGNSLKNMVWKPQIRKNSKLILIAWFAPAVLTAVGGVLYFLFFPKHFDLSGSYIVVNGGKETLEQMEAQGITYPVYVLISLVSALTYAPLINTFLGLGEEIGWRGFLYPQLKAKFGRTKGWLIGGVIWGMWHWPLIWLIGYEYGTEYIGFPVSGMLIFCINTVVLGILCDWLYEKSDSIWLPALFHGAINAVAAIPLTVCLTNTGSMRLLGPAPNGLIAELPLVIVAVALLVSAQKEHKSVEKKD